MEVIMHDCSTCQHSVIRESLGKDLARELQQTTGLSYKTRRRLNRSIGQTLDILSLDDDDLPDYSRDVELEVERQLIEFYRTRRNKDVTDLEYMITYQDPTQRFRHGCAKYIASGEADWTDNYTTEYCVYTHLIDYWTMDLVQRQNFVCEYCNQTQKYGVGTIYPISPLKFRKVVDQDHLQFNGGTIIMPPCPEY